MLKSLTSVQKYVLYEALLHAIRTDFRIGFYNQDTGHLCYILGERGDLMPDKDTPEHNALFQVMHEICKHELVDGGKTLTIHEPVYCWADFCRIVLAANKANGKRRDG